MSDKFAFTLDWALITFVLLLVLGLALLAIKGMPGPLVIR